MKRPVLVLLALLSLVSFANDPTPAFSSGAVCTSNYQCPTGELCCYMCGNPPEGDDSFCRICVTPVRGRCPMVV